MTDSPKRRFLFYSLAHSGGRAVQDWFLRNFNHGKKVEVSLSVNQILTNLDRNILFYYKSKFNKEIPSSAYESEKMQNVFYDFLESEIHDNISSKDKIYQIVVLRDPLNLAASRQKLDIYLVNQQFTDLWLKHANFCLSAIQEAQSGESRNVEKFFILYNRWVMDKSYRDSICQQFGVENLDKFNQVTNLGQGSSYIGQAVEEQKENYLTRFRLLKWNSELLQSLQNNQLIKLTKQLFTKIPIVPILVDGKNQISAQAEPEPKATEPKLEEQKIEQKAIGNIGTEAIPEPIRETGIPFNPVEAETHEEATKPPDVLPNINRKTIPAGHKSLGVSMIVKNEEEIITKCLASIVDYLDYFVIHDTGSTDSTPEKILEFMKKHGVPGEVHYMPWKNFGWNRTQAIRMARKKTDYCLLLDADFVVTVNNTSFKQQLGSPGYLIRYLGGLDYRQILLIACKHNWEYYGVTHEYIDTKPQQLPVEITEVLNIEHTGEGSNRSEKFMRDVKLLKQGIIDEPENARYYFYLAQSYKDWGKYDEAIEAYLKRVSFGNWDEEVFYSYYQIAMCKKRRGDDFYEYVGDYLKAYNIRKQRIEPLYQILEDCAYDEDKALMGYRIGMMNHKVEYPTYDLLFIEKPLYMWMYLDMLATCAHTAGLYQEALEITERIVKEGKYGEHQAVRFQNNLRSLRIIVNNQNVSNLKPQPFTFIRNQPGNKTNRVAVIIANYNMPERANQLVVNLQSMDNQYPLDIIVVDNGSDITAPSQFTTLFLAKNVQTCHAWLNGLHYADSLEVNEQFKYFAYVFVITSAEITSQYINGRGVVTPMAQVLLNDQDIVGVHPSLTVDSTTHWKQLITQLPPKIRQTNMIDNIFSMYRADWFNSIGRFDPQQTYAWGIDIETSYLARKEGKKVVVLDGILVRKISNIGYTINRMNMSADQRIVNASKQMNSRLTEKYGQTWAQEIDKYTIGEQIRQDYIEEIPKRLHNIMLSFEKIECAHSMLMEYIFRNHMKYMGSTDDLVLLEIGSTRDNYPHMGSTRKLCRLASVYGYHFISVDMDPQITEKNRKSLEKCDMNFGLNGFKYDCINAKGEDFTSDPSLFIKNWDNKKIYFIYLDGFDFSNSEDHHSAELKETYRKYLNKEITNYESAKMHLTCVKNLLDQLPFGCLICISNHLEKGKTAVPYLIDQGWQILKENTENQCSGILLMKGNNSSSSRPLNRSGFDGGRIMTQLKPNPDDRPVNEQEKISQQLLAEKQSSEIRLVNNEWIVTLMGYNFKNHTNWYPWNRFNDVFKTEGYQVDWVTLEELKKKRLQDQRRRIFICWNEPTSLELVRSGMVKKDDVILQKLTSLGKGMERVNWGSDPVEFFKKWNWPIYQTVEYLYDLGFNIYGFGCKTRSDIFPEKNRIVQKLEQAGRLFWINWGSTMFSKKEIEECEPVIGTKEDFQYEVGFVGSKWGQVGRGNIDQWEKYMDPLLEGRNSALYGSGLPNRPIPDDKAKDVLRKSLICPIIHAPSWVAEEGIQDRFYSIFTAGRFGVCDNPGVYEFFDKDEVVVETDPVKFLEKSIYYMEHPEEQRPFIEKVQAKIKSKYNFYTEWNDILTNIISNQTNKVNNTDEFYTKLEKVLDLYTPFIDKPINQ